MAQARRHDIDHLRNLAVLLLVVFHTARLFDAEPWHLKDTPSHAAADLLVRLMNQWHMPLLFLLAGMSAWLALERNGVGAFVTERVQRLLVPLLAGLFLFVLPQVYLERIAVGMPGRMSPIDTELGFLAFVPTFLACCYPAANLSWHHLWFLAYLFVYSLLVAALFAGLRRFGALDLVPQLGAWLARGWRAFLPAVLLVAVELALRFLFPATHAFVGDWANHAHYAALVLLGLPLAASPRGIEHLPWRSALLAAAAATLLWLVLRGSGVPHLALAARTFGEWCWLLGLLGLGHRYLNRPLPLLTRFTPWAMPFYLVHQTVIILLAWLLAEWTGQPGLKFAAIAAGTTLGSLAIAWLLAQSGTTRFLVGLKGPRPAAPARPAPAMP